MMKYNEEKILKLTNIAYLFTNFIFERFWCFNDPRRKLHGDTFMSLSTRKSAIFSALLLGEEKSSLGNG